MAASANDSQGLKIAVAAFVSLTVILAVTSYFLYSNYSQTFEKLTASEQKAQTSQNAASAALLQYDELRQRIGSRAEEFDAAKSEIQAEQKKIDDDVSSLIGQANEAITKIQAAGGTGPELEDAKAKVLQISNAYLTEPNKNYISSLSRLKDLLKTLVLLDLGIARDYSALKKDLESTNSVNQSKLDVATKGFNDAKNDLQQEHSNHGQARDELLTKVDQYQIENARLATEISALTNKLRQQEEDYTKKLRLAQDTLREYRDQSERKETVLDSPDGSVNYVDYSTFQVRTRVYFVCNDPLFAVFDVNDATREVHYTSPFEGKYVVKSMKLKYIGDDGTGFYYQYQNDVTAGGLVWFLPKTKRGYVYWMYGGTASPRIIPYGPSVRFPPK